MSELIPIIETLVADAEVGQPGALCVVVKTHGSTPQSPGAAMAVRADFSTLGTLGGGCAEAEVRKRAFELLQQASSGLLDLDLDHDYGWDDGLICGGRMQVAAMPVRADVNLDAFKDALGLAKRHEPARFPIIVEQDGKRLEYRVHLEVSPALVIAGAGHVGQAIARLAVDLDFHVVVIDDRAEVAARSRFDERVELVVDDIARALREPGRWAVRSGTPPRESSSPARPRCPPYGDPIDAGCYVVVVTRGHRHDYQALEAVVRRPAGYIGMIGSKRKSAAILKALADEGVSPELIERVHTPIGLPIRAVTVNEIAVSIMAEIIEVRRRKTPKLVEGPM